MKTVPRNVQLVTQDQAVDVGGLPEEVSLALADIAGVAREGLLAMSVAAGMAVMAAMFEAEITVATGPKGRHDPQREAVRHGTGKGSLTLGGRRVAVSRPQARTLDGHEVPLDTYTAFTADDLLGQVVLERMLAGVATRRHTRIGEPVGKDVLAGASSTGRSAVSRRFIKETETALAELLARDLSELSIKVLMLDGEHMAGRCVIVALGITADGGKVPVGLWDGATENKTVVRSMLADLLSRGRCISGATSPITCRTRRRRCWTSERQAPRWAAREHLPRSANSLREGLEEMFTVARLGIDGRLAKTLVTSNPVESMISIARTTNRNVTRWRDGHMVLRWTAAGMLNAERSFRRIKGCKQMPQLVAALHRHAHPVTAAPTDTVGAAA